MVSDSHQVMLKAVFILFVCALLSFGADAPKDDDARLMKKFIDAYKILDQNTADPFDLDKAFYDGAIPGLLRHLDPHSVFFDPGRVKDNILPNRQIGRPLRAGHTYTLEVSTGWHDAQGQPLKAVFRRSFRVGPADAE